MWTELHWVDGPWLGKLALAARPRGGEWLDEELARWQESGVHTVFSLLTPQEQEDLDLKEEERKAKARRMEFRSFPIPDRQVPDSEARLARALEKLDKELASGRNVVLHCRQGIGRSGLVAACLLVTKGLETGAAIRRLSAARGVSIPETSEQRRWIDHFAGTVANLT